MKMNLADYLDVHPDIKLADVAVTLQSGRRNFAHRAFVVSVQSDEAASKLRKGAIEGIAPDATTPVVFMFPGQGAQYPGMGKALYASEPIYRHWIDKGAAVLLPHIGLDIRDLLLNEAHEGADATHQLHWTVYAQPALFLVEYALAQVWMARGVRPSAMIGHSIGELVAATLAETMTFESALTLIAARGALMQSTEPGAMLAVRLPESELRSLLPPDIDIAALNAPSLSVVAGPFDAIGCFRDASRESRGTPQAFAYFARLPFTHDGCCGDGPCESCGQYRFFPAQDPLCLLPYRGLGRDRPACNRRLLGQTLPRNCAL